MLCLLLEQLGAIHFVLAICTFTYYLLALQNYCVVLFFFINKIRVNSGSVANFLEETVGLSTCF